jgi:hypothetical protein
LAATTAGSAPRLQPAAQQGLLRPQRKMPRVDAGGTRLRLHALHLMGHTTARISQAAGSSEHVIRRIVRGDVKTVSPRLRDAITAVYNAWWDKRPPQRTRAERAAATAARRRAIAGNWCPGAALDDDLLDIPGYRPGHGWRPARGTGTAPTSTRQPGTSNRESRKWSWEHE